MCGKLRQVQDVCSAERWMVSSFVIEVMEIAPSFEAVCKGKAEFEQSCAQMIAD